jgi:hypothetical protein
LILLLNNLHPQTRADFTTLRWRHKCVLSASCHRPRAKSAGWKCGTLNAGVQWQFPRFPCGPHPVSHRPRFRKPPSATLYCWPKDAPAKRRQPLTNSSEAYALFLFSIAFFP